MENPWHPALQKPQIFSFFCSTATLQDGQDVLQEVKGASMPPQAYKALRALDAQSILEEVYRAAPVPEEYMKYQLHLSTGMEVPQIELWFQNRRTTDGSSGAPAEGHPDWPTVQRPTVQITSGAERLPSHSGQRRPGRPDLAQPPKALEARSNSGNGRLARRPSQGPVEQHAKVSEHSEGHDGGGNSMQPFPFPGLPPGAEAGSAQREGLREGQLAGLPPLDWLSDANPHPEGGRQADVLGGHAARQSSTGLIETSIGDPAELLSQPNAPFLLNFLSSHRDSKDGAGGASDNGGFKAPAAPGEQQGLRHQRSSGSDQEPLRTANRPPTTPGSLRQSQSPRHALQHHHSLGQQQAPPPPRQWLNHHAEASAPMLDCSDILPPDSSSPEWQGQMLTAMGGSMPVTASSRPWRQNWGHLGSQAFPDHDMVYSMSMNSSMESSRDAFSMRNSEASQQMDEIEHRQLLERGTVSLPALRDFRQELHKGAAWQPDSMRASGAGDLASWRRPGAAASEETPAFIPSPNRVNSQEQVAPPADSSLGNRISESAPAKDPPAAQGDLPTAGRRPSKLPRSISDISETHNLQAYASLKDHGSATDANLLTEDAAPAGCEAAEAVSEARFVEGDLESVVGLIGLQTITSEQEYDGSRKLFLFEQLTHLDSLDINTSASHPAKRRRVRHQHFWRNSDKLPPDHRLYVTSADIKQALEESEPVRGRRQITSAERTNMWSVCLTSKGVLNYLNRRISPVGVRLFRASQRQFKGGLDGLPASDKPLLPPMLAPRPKPLQSPAAASAAAEDSRADDDSPAAGTRKRRSRLRRESSQ